MASANSREDWRRYRFAAGVLALAAALTVVGAALAAPVLPKLTGRVVDGADLLSAAEEASLTRKLADLEAKSSDQLAVATVPSLQGYDIREFGLLLAREWALGQKDKNNGVLLLVAPKERKVSIEVGYGLEPTLTDALSHLIIQRAILPRFKAGDMPAGIDAGVDEIIKVLLGNAKDVEDRLGIKGSTDTWPPILVIVLWLALIGLIVYAIYRDGGFQAGRGGPTSGRRSGGWSSGGSSRGWSGGGGSFGGGGSSGSW